MRVQDSPATNDSLPVEDDFIAVDSGSEPAGPSMSIVVGLIIAICAFTVLGMYCERRRKKRHYPHDWNNTSTFTSPWFLYQLKNFGEFHSERLSLLKPNKDITINIFSSKNRANSKYPKTKKTFPYFVTIPEEEEEDEGEEDPNIVTFQNKIYPKSFPHF